MMKFTVILSIALLAFLPAEPATAQTQNDDLIAAYERRIEQQQQQLDDMRRELEALKKAVGHPSAGSPVVAEAAVAEAAAGEPEAAPPGVGSKNGNLSLKLSGRVHRMFLTVDDGVNSDLYFTDSEQGPTMLRLDATGRVSDTLTIGGTLETGIRENRPFQVSQDNPQGGTSVNVRIAEAYFQSARLGRLSLGRGFASGWMSPEIDLSGTQLASLLPVGMLAPGMKFVNAADDSLSKIQVLTHFVDSERLLLVDRARYDSVSFGPGLQLSGSVSSDGRWDTALRAKPKSVGDWTLVSGAAYLNKPADRIDRRYDAAVSALHKPTGLNLTTGFARERLTSGRYSNTYVVKAGWLADLVSLGKTAFSIDYYSASDLRLEDDKAKSYGLFAVQKWPAYGLDFYAGYRRYDVDRPDIELKKLDVYVLGFGFSF